MTDPARITTNIHLKGTDLEGKDLVEILSSKEGTDDHHYLICLSGLCAATVIVSVEQTVAIRDALDRALGAINLGIADEPPGVFDDSPEYLAWCERLATEDELRDLAEEARGQARAERLRGGR